MSHHSLHFRVSRATRAPESHTQTDLRIKDLHQSFHPQREWAQGQGLLLILAHFLTGAGAGTWFFAALFDLGLGLVVGYSFVVLGGLLHLLFLGHPERFWRMMKNFTNSWISRGLAGMAFFIVTGFFYLLCSFLNASQTILAQAASVLSFVSAFWIVIYKGFVWASSKGIPLWNTPLVPVLYIAYALRAGTAVLLLLAPSLTHQASPAHLEPVKLWLAVSTAVLVLVYLSIMRGSGATALRSVDLLLFGRVAVPFYVGAVLLGLFIPIVVGALAAFAYVPTPFIIAAAIFSLLGDLSIIYSIARAGLYRPLPV